MQVTLYTTHCPKCKIIESKLAEHNIDYLEVTDVDFMKELGFMEVPIVRVDNEYKNFRAAVDWLNRMDK